MNAAAAGSGAVAAEDPIFRPLRAFAFDPGGGSGPANLLALRLPWEPLRPGPAGGRVAVIDYDAAGDRYWAPVDLDDPRLRGGGLDPDPGHPFFHQQMAFAIASWTIRNFELALGRRVRWSFDRNQRADRPLRILPHGVEEANAWYERELRALVFGHFAAPSGERIFACLSHDVVAHETTHALVDGLRRYFREPASDDTLAFHEALADLVALFQHFAFPEALLETVRRTGGRIHEPLPGAGNPLVELARQFGEALGLGRALRSALGAEGDAAALDPHARGSVLVAAVFDAFFAIYAKRTADLFELARCGDPREPIPEPLAARLAAEAAKVARRFLSLCIRALDYCPPVGVTFGDYLRALLTADLEAVPEDRQGWREAIVGAFRRRSLLPPDLPPTVSALCWQPPPFTGDPPRCAGLTFDVLLRRRDPRRGSRNARLLHAFANEHRAALGLAPGIPIHSHSFECVGRTSPAGDPRFGFVAELVQTVRRRLPCGTQVPIRGGVTLVLDPEGRVLYAIGKPLDEAAIAARLAFAATMRGSPHRLGIDFRALHRQASAAGGAAPFDERWALEPAAFRRLHPHLPFDERDERAFRRQARATAPARS